MKKFYSIFCIALIVCCSSLFVACNKEPNKPKDNQIEVSYSELSSLTLTEQPNNWSKLSAIKIDSNGEEKITINKTEVDSQAIPASIQLLSSKNQNKDIRLNYIIENDNEKIYCKNNVRYHKNNNRNYIDESEFDEQEFINDIIDEYLENAYEFFSIDNSKKLISSSRQELKNSTIITFEAMLDKQINTILKVTLTLNKNNILTCIKIEITSNDNSKEINVEVKESEEVVNTPEWFDNNDYKKPLTYEQVKAIATDNTLTDDWSCAELFLPVGYSDDNEDKIIYTSTANQTITITDTYKIYADGNYLYTYKNNEPVSKENLNENNDLKQEFSYSNIINEFQTFTYNSFFIFEEQYIEYYEAAKKYEKDITVVSYKYIGTSGHVQFEALCSLYFDVDDNFYKVECYVKQYDITNISNPELMFEMNLYMKSINNMPNITWFDSTDFEN